MAQSLPTIGFGPGGSIGRVVLFGFSSGAAAPTVAVIVRIADAVKDALNNASLSQSFTAERAYAPPRSIQESDVDDLDDLTVLVIPRQLGMTRLSRRDDDFDYAVDIGVFKRLTRGLATEAEVVDECDPLMLLVEEIADLFRGNTVLADIPGRFQGLTNVPIYDPGLLAERRVFASLLTLTFQKARQRDLA